jgi:hypothetical protein
VWIDYTKRAERQRASHITTINRTSASPTHPPHTMNNTLQLGVDGRAQPRLQHHALAAQHLDRGPHQRPARPDGRLRIPHLQRYRRSLSAPGWRPPPAAAAAASVHGRGVGLGWLAGASVCGDRNTGVRVCVAEPSEREGRLGGRPTKTPASEACCVGPTPGTCLRMVVGQKKAVSMRVCLGPPSLSPPSTGARRVVGGFAARAANVAGNGQQPLSRRTSSPNGVLGGGGT